MAAMPAGPGSGSGIPSLRSVMFQAWIGREAAMPDPACGGSELSVANQVTSAPRRCSSRASRPATISMPPRWLSK